MKITFPNPDIESRRLVQVVDVHKESTKTKYTLLVMKLFNDFLGALRTCASIVISMPGFGTFVKLGLFLLFMYSNQCDAKESCDALSVQVLGSGGPELTKNRASSSYVVWLDNRAVLMIDAGGGSSFRYGQSGARWQDLEAVLFTHYHVDHSGDFPAFIKASWFGERSRDLPVYGPYGNRFMPSTQEFLDNLFGKGQGAFRYLSDMYNDMNSNGYHLIAHTILDKSELQLIFETKTLKVKALKVEHGPIPAFAYIIYACGKTIVFSGDTNGKGFEKLKLKKTDVFIAHNAIPENAGQVAKFLHMTPLQIGRIAQSLKTSRLILSHRMNRTLGRERQTIKGVQKNYIGKLQFADDLDIIPLR